MYAFMADTHIGVKLPIKDFMNSLEMFLEGIRKHKEDCHGIFVCGDLFEHRLSIEDASFASMFISRLVYNHCSKNGLNVPIYILHGTSSHDQNQYPIFLQMIDECTLSHVFYCDKVCSITLFDGKRALFLPQEYTDVDYKPFFENQHYDIIVGHGPISSTNKNPCKCASYEIVHSAELLGSISDICVFGHYHGFTDFGNNVFYTGPWLQWKYGEDEPRVFFYCNDKMEVETVPNPYWMEFKTIEIGNTDELREYLAQDINNPHRFIIQSKPSDMETYRGIINSTKSNMVKFQLEEVIDEDDLGLSVDEVLDAQTEVVQPMDTLSTYIKDKYSIDADDQLRQYESIINKEEKE